MVDFSAGKITLQELRDRHVAAMQSQKPATAYRKVPIAARLLADLPGDANCQTSGVSRSSAEAWLAKCGRTQGSHEIRDVKTTVTRSHFHLNDHCSVFRDWAVFSCARQTSSPLQWSRGRCRQCPERVEKTGAPSCDAYAETARLQRSNTPGQSSSRHAVPW